VISLYDPMGFVSPFTFKAKLMLQKLWRKEKGWDEPIDEEDKEVWDRWTEDLPKLNQVAIPRNIMPQNEQESNSFELHCFADASELGYGAVAYLRSISGNGKIKCAFVMGKSRLAPIKSLTIPRLELQAAVLAVRLGQTVKEELDIPGLKLVYWSDSTTVLHFIRNESRRFQVFVANRLAEIHENTVQDQWHYVPTENSPADYVTRGLSADQFTTPHRWLGGPEFLLQSEENWPAFPNRSDVAEEALSVETKKEVHTTQADDTATQRLLERYSSWDKLRLSAAWLLRYKEFLRGQVAKRKGDAHDCPEGLKEGPISGSEMKKAGLAIIRAVQEGCFESELASIADARDIPRSSDIRRLKPIVVDGIVRVGGRLANAPISFEAKHPVILPKNHAISRLIMQYYHEILGHVGPDHVLAELRQNYWIVHARSYVRKLGHSCFKCLLRRKKSGQQQMADLPAFRVTPHEPAFSDCGVDYFGPLKVKVGRGTAKRYGCLFTCLNCRAVHIEVANSLETDSFINALRRFICRRGCPRSMKSDNGTNFVGGHRELKKSIQEMDNDGINRFLRTKNISWNFNTPAASHHGGVWERLIRSVRKVLHGVIGDALLTDETLTTWLAEVEAILNSRPLTSLSDDPDDAEPLTPNHLLLQLQGPVMPPGSFDRIDGHGRRRWRQAQYLADQFWKRWTKEYIPLLQERRKWQSVTKNFEPGELVLVIDETMPRSNWSLGRVSAVFPGQDGCVRTVSVQTKGTVLTRPITKTCFLENSVC
ncbi:MAG: hypothetical protein AAF438_20615, partial [Pseudomonadota bacterium]